LPVLILQSFWRVPFLLVGIAAGLAGDKRNSLDTGVQKCLNSIIITLSMTFNYQKIYLSLLKDLPQRTTNIIERRFGLKTAKRETLEAIGKSYGITRERVRQIENEGLSQIQSKIKEHQRVFQYFNDTLKSLGDLNKEKSLLYTLGGKNYQNHVFFLLTLDDNFERFSEDKEFYSFWARKKEAVNSAKKIINLTLNKFEKKKEPLSLDKLFEIQKTELSKILGKKPNKTVFRSYLEISKKIQKNPEGQLGLKDWPEINPRGIKDRAYLVLKRQGEPLHFAQVAALMEKLSYPFRRKTHIATVHNELIKDSRFVLVGRGLYALKEWGYAPGMVRDVILRVLKEAKQPLSKEEISERVLEQRFVKENTIFLNLQNKNYFFKDSQGRYTIKES